MKAILLALASMLAFGQASANSSLDRARMLIGTWLERDAKVEFRYEASGTVIVGRARPNGNAPAWMEMMVIYSERDASPLCADSFAPDRRVIHYRLRKADDRTLEFASPTGDVLTWTRLDANRLGYRFETNGATSESGTLLRVTNIRPLSENPRLIRPLSE